MTRTSDFQVSFHPPFLQTPFLTQGHSTEGGAEARSGEDEASPAGPVAEEAQALGQKDECGSPGH